VGLVEVWTDYLGAPHTWGNAVDLLANASRSAFNVIYNTPDGVNSPVQPEPGDLIVWKANAHYPGILSTGGYGHVAIFVSGDINNYFTSLDQNFPTGTGVKYVNHPYQGVAGWIHPFALDTPPAMIAAVAPTPEVIVTTPVQTPVITQIATVPPAVATTFQPAPVVDTPHGAVPDGPVAVRVVPEYESSYVEHPCDLTLEVDSAAIDFAGQNPPVAFKKGQQLAIAGYFIASGRYYQRGKTSAEQGKWYGISVHDFADDPTSAFQQEVAVNEAAAALEQTTKLSWFGKLLRFLGSRFNK
jgi:hypothetical protein